MQNTEVISTTTSAFYWLYSTKSQFNLCMHKQNSSGRVRAILLIISGLKTNPGPRKYSPKFPCGVCNKACKWGQKAIACDECDQWYHVACMGMNSSTYEHLGNTSVSWYCTTCNKPNHNTTVYDTIMTCSNTYSVLGNISSPGSQHTSSLLDTSIDSNLPGSRRATSSPKSSTKERRDTPKRNTRKNIRLLCVNFQSIKNKAPELRVLLESTNHDILIGCETWTNQSMFSSEFIPDDYEVRRRDRGTDDHGGVLIATKKDLVTSEIRDSKEAELLTIKVDLPQQKSLIVTSYYRPPNRTDDLYIDTTVRDITDVRRTRQIQRLSVYTRRRL